MTGKNKKCREHHIRQHLRNGVLCLSSTSSQSHRVKVITTQKLAAEIKHRKKSEGLKYKTEAKRK
jgi:hypothetical protein